jgi:putative DNA primase/helicase
VKAHFREHRPTDYITKMIPHNYNPEAKCTNWLKFLNKILPEGGLVNFVHQALGYSLTGDTSEKMIFLAKGPKDTGKTTLLNTVHDLLGDYAGRIKVESLMMDARRTSLDANAQADLADLRGKRFIMTSETAEGQRLREELIKLLAQGQGNYRAVRKYQNPFEFPETWKIWIDCNHLPLIQGTDDAIWERLAVIPFEHPVPKAERDPALHKFFTTVEAEGILAWLVQGNLLWRENGGLVLPDAMLKARNAWRSNMDDMGQWIASDTVLGPECEAKSHELYLRYKGWAESRKLYVLSETAFSLRMQERFNKVARHSGAFFIGVRLASAEEMKARGEKVEKF